MLKNTAISARNEKLRQELNNSSLLDDMTQALTQMKEMFPDICVADEFAKLQTVKAYVIFAWLVLGILHIFKF